MLIPAHDEAGSIADTIRAVLAQTRLADRVIVIPNGCTDDTATIARSFPVEVMELPALPHRKSQALNTAWEQVQEYDMIVCLDADTILPPNAIQDWVEEMERNPTVGGSSSKFTMQQPGILSRLQKAEFATWTQSSLDNGFTTVLAGTGCAVRGEALRRVADRDDREGPWCYTSATEDFELTHRVRELGYACQVSPSVRAYTDSMRTVRALWGQRIKWQVGTVEDLLAFGLNRLTWRDWAQQAMCLFNVFSKAFLVWFWAYLTVTGQITFIWFWWVFPLLFVGMEYIRYRSIPHRDKKDLAIALSFFPNEAFQWMRAAWVAASWVTVLSGRKRDLWAAQAKAEGHTVTTA
ncbi:glycosyltransferase family 2 protein [Salana multivorans]